MDKLTKRELKTPDKVWQASRMTLDWLTSQWVALVVSVVIVIACILIGVFIYQSKMNREGKADFHLGLAKTSFEEWKTKTGDEKTKAGESFKKELEVLEKEFPQSKANVLAYSIRGEFALQQGKSDEAIADYKAYEKGLDTSSKIFAWMPLAQVLEDSKKYDQALQVYNQVLSLKSSAVADAASLSKARVLRMLNRNEEAKTIYTTYLEKNPRTAETPLVRGLLSETLEALEKAKNLKK